MSNKDHVLKSDKSVRKKVLLNCALSINRLASTGWLFEKLLDGGFTAQEIQTLLKEFECGKPPTTAARNNLLLYCAGIALNHVVYNNLRQDTMSTSADLVSKCYAYASLFIASNDVIMVPFIQSLESIFGPQATQGNNFLQTMEDMTEEILSWFFQSFNIRNASSSPYSLSPSELFFVPCCEHCTYCNTPKTKNIAQGCIKKVEAGWYTYKRKRTCELCSPRKISFGSNSTRNIPMYSDKQKQRLFYTPAEIHSFIEDAAFELNNKVFSQ